MPEPQRLILHQAQIGPMANYVYLIGDAVTRKAAVVDPAWDVDKILAWAERHGLAIEHVLITHYHPDPLRRGCSSG
jgi:glyoxylase-like metal-dependent hydrolase (beta-lactamase superfamily II)